MNDEFAKLVEAEEAKRNRHVSPQQKREMLLQALENIESLPTGRRNTKEACLRAQEQQLAEMEAYRARSRPPTST